MDYDHDIFFQHISSSIFCFGLALIAICVGYWFNYFVKLSEDEDRFIFPLSKVLWGFGTYFVVQLLLFPLLIVVGLMLYYRSTTFPEAIHEEYFQGWIRSLCLLAGFFSILIYCRALGKDIWDYIWFRHHSKTWSRIGKAVLLGIATWFIAFPLIGAASNALEAVQVYYSFQTVPLDQVAVKYLKDLMHYPALFAVTALLFSFIVPIAEELLFRGLLQSRFSSIMQPSSAIVLTSGIFAALHFSVEQGFTNFELLSSLFILSCFLGYIYERQKNLWASIALHMTFNLLSIITIAYGEGLIIN